MLSYAAYEALPYAYLSAGVASMTLLDSQFRLLPGLSLIGAGALVLLWRLSARARARRRGRVSRACRALRNREDLLA